MIQPTQQCSLGYGDMMIWYKEGASCAGDFNTHISPSATPANVSARFVPEFFCDLELNPNMGTSGGSSCSLCVST